MLIETHRSTATMRDRVDLMAAEHRALHHDPVATLWPAQRLELLDGISAGMRLHLAEAVDLVVLCGGV